MRSDAYAESRGDETYESPFAAMTPTAEYETLAQEELGADEFEDSPFESFSAAESPFGGESPTEAEEASEALRDFMEALRDEEFEDALEQLLNEGAALTLAGEQEAGAPLSEAETRDALEQWLTPLAEAWTRTVDGLAAGLENAEVLGMGESEFEQLLESLETPVGFTSEGFENFFGKLVRKAKSALKSAVRFAKNPIGGVVDIAKRGIGVIKSGVSAIGKHLLGPLLRKLKRVGLALLKGVVQKLIRPLTRLLPASVRPLVPILMKRLGVAEAETGPYSEDNLWEAGS
ncbi:hypothetical protein [Nocardia sp. NPDC004711]